MSQFNGMSDVELDMIHDNVRKKLPLFKYIVPSCVELTIEHYKEYAKQEGISDDEKMKLAVISAQKWIGG